MAPGKPRNLRKRSEQFAAGITKRGLVTKEKAKPEQPAVSPMMVAFLFAILVLSVVIGVIDKSKFKFGR